MSQKQESKTTSSEHAENAENAENVAMESAYVSHDQADFFNGQALIPGMGRRMLAYIIDFAIVFFLGLIFHMSILWTLTGTNIAAMLANLFVLGFLLLATNAAYHVFLESNPKLRATLGKRIMGLEVVDVEGQPLDRPQAVQRFIWRLPSILGICVPYLIAGRGNYGLALHDLKALTVVIVRSIDKSRVESGLRAGRERTKADILCLLIAGLFLAYIVFNIVKSLLHII